jgi:hypothetical protein
VLYQLSYRRAHGHITRDHGGFRGLRAASVRGRGNPSAPDRFQRLRLNPSQLSPVIAEPKNEEPTA